MITYKTDSKASLQSSESSMPVLAMCYDFDKTLTPDDNAGTRLYPICWL